MTAVLAIDTATNACSAALWVDGDVRASRSEPMARGHAERLVPMIQEIAEAADRAVKSVDLIAVTVGPG
ncbi:MAG: tRNA (adenosine(37)-N6)-threonylcarbamoyltransferase complex dimerization subunit type 1 TsaB, partial [Rhodospirillales bacterium]|nr:tRNA (adenosine(37)-N6)-threonylcarbamoyltransferase complex dimerization subunit type 1 TsaB [Rhodospirillales bacterium]